MDRGHRARSPPARLPAHSAAVCFPLNCLQKLQPWFLLQLFNSISPYLNYLFEFIPQTHKTKFAGKFPLSSLVNNRLGRYSGMGKRFPPQLQDSSTHSKMLGTRRLVNRELIVADSRGGAVRLLNQKWAKIFATVHISFCLQAARIVTPSA